ncbi:putative J domain-containing protein [Zancudomyces culisetae]|uniref:Putative J domain-containing protein n=1 Tax=Zancudomyces culisetae TaxID=1213189 RepID=A0A1R1PP07_ZANCU|nr:putative J domain-containing protein [Zancudomyces culisetae]|eukprot:OMH82699.1 putative J domain-containing protein [Zancudomyces culisetae]
MKSFRFSVLVLLSLLCLFINRSFAWEKLDFEIFELWDSIKKNDKTTNWYELMGVPSSATSAQINKAYKRLSLKYHPDKLRGTKKEMKRATEKYTRLGLVANILRDKYSRKRYDFFKKNGVPVWRGADYLYKRYRPGLGSVGVGLALFFSAMQYMFMSLSYWRAQQRIKIIEEEGEKLKLKAPPQLRATLNRRERRGKSGKQELYDEFVGDEDDDSLAYVTELDPYSVKKPTIADLLVISFPMWIIRKVGTSVGLMKPIEQDSTSISEDDSSEEVDQGDFKEKFLLKKEERDTKNVSRKQKFKASSSSASLASSNKDSVESDASNGGSQNQVSATASGKSDSKASTPLTPKSKTVRKRKGGTRVV